jgi:molybdopterin adenylyltransferase
MYQAGPRVPIDETLAFTPLRIAVLTISDSRTFESDKSGEVLAQRIKDAGHFVADRRICIDEVAEIVSRLFTWIDASDVDCIITTGGTGITGRDVTPEALNQLEGKTIDGFGELFRWISFQKIGTSTIQSRALARVVRGTYIFALPGSPGAVRDGWDGILAQQLDSRFRPCNFVELIPRLRQTDKPESDDHEATMAFPLPPVKSFDPGQE